MPQILEAQLEALEAAAAWYDREALLKGPRRTLAAAIRRMFAAQERRTLDGIARLAAMRIEESASEAQALAALESLTEPEMMRELEIAIGETEGEILEPMIEAGDAAMVAGANVTLEQVQARMVFTFSRGQERNLEWLRAQGARMVSRVSDTTRRRMRRLIVSQSEAGKGRGDIEKVIRSTFRGMRTRKPQRHIKDRADLITVTELGNAFEHGGRTVASDLERGGIPLEKRWFNSGDDRVSDGCLANSDAGWIPNRQDFPSGHGAPLRFPGCRCTTVRRVAEPDA